jgi:hypothetical protein
MSYGVTTDYLGFGSVSGFEVQSSDKNTNFGVSAQVMDSNGDIACETKAQTVTEVSVSYQLCGGSTVNFDTAAVNLKIGEVVSFDTITHYQITGFDVSTSNSGFPTVNVSATQDPDTAATTHATYSSALSVVASKSAQSFGLLSYPATSKLSTGSASVGGSLVTVADSQGEIVCREPHGVRVTGSHSLQSCTLDPSDSIVADTANGWFFENTPSLSMSNTDYSTASAEVAKNVIKD